VNIEERDQLSAADVLTKFLDRASPVA